MKSLINIQQSDFNGQKTNAVSARELHKFLESKRQFADWVKPYIVADNDYGFLGMVDFISIHAGVNPTNHVPVIDYAFTVEMAKEVSMLSKTEKGKQALKYFIEWEGLNAKQQITQQPKHDGLKENKMSSISITDQKQIFHSELFGDLTTLTQQDGAIWFVAGEVCKILGLSNTTTALSNIDSEDRAKNFLGGQEINIINEAGLYMLVMRSSKPNAKPFQKWVTKDILPSIRKTGSYGRPQIRLPNTKELAYMLIQSEDEKEKLQLELKQAA